MASCTSPRRLRDDRVPRAATSASTTLMESCALSLRPSSSAERNTSSPRSAELRRTRDGARCGMKAHTDKVLSLPPGPDAVGRGNADRAAAGREAAEGGEKQSPEDWRLTTAKHMEATLIEEPAEGLVAEKGEATGASARRRGHDREGAQQVAATVGDIVRSGDSFYREAMEETSRPAARRQADSERDRPARRAPRPGDRRPGARPGTGMDGLKLVSK